MGLGEGELEGAGGGLEGFYLFEVDEGQGVFGELVVVVEGVGVACLGAGVPLKKWGMVEK